MSEMFTCKYCGDNLPVRFGAEMADGQKVCPSCGIAIDMMVSFGRNEMVLLTSKHPFWGDDSGFSNVTTLNAHLNIDKIRADCPDLKEIPLSKEEMDAVASCVAAKNEADPLWNERFSIYKGLAHRIATIMKVKELSEKQLKREVKEFWKEYEDDIEEHISMGMFGFQGNTDRALIAEKFDFEALMAMIAEIT